MVNVIQEEINMDEINADHIRITKIKSIFTSYHLR